MNTSLPKLALSWLIASVICYGQSIDEQKERLVARLSSKSMWPGSMPSRTGVGDPIFSANFDWDTQEKIRETISEFSHSGDPASWELLVSLGEGYEHQYSVTLMFNNRPGGNYSVSKICRLIALRRLLYPVESCLGEIRTIQPGYLSSIEDDLGIRDRIPKYSIVSWRRDHADLNFLQLQETVCERAAQFLERDQRLDDETKKEALSRLAGYLTVIRQEHKIIPPDGDLFRLGYALYDQEPSEEQLRRFAKKVLQIDSR